MVTVLLLMGVQEKLLLMNDSEKIKKFAERIAIPLSNTDNIKWPIRSGRIISFVNDIYANEFITDLKMLVSTVPRDLWGTAFYNSLSIWKISHHIINGLRKLDISNKEIAEDILLMCNVLDVITQEKWLELSSHLVLSHENIKSITNKYIHHYSKRTNTLLAMVSAALWAYADTLFFQGREICCERHGLYVADNNTKLFITDVNGIDEAASALWPCTYKRIDSLSIRVVLAYNNEFEMTVDPYNNTDLINGSFIESCCGGAVIIDGNVLSEYDISLLLSNLINKINYQAQVVNSLSIEELAKIYIKIFWYRKKKLSEAVGKEWMPDKKIYQYIDINSLELERQDNSQTESYESQVKEYDFSSFL